MKNRLVALAIALLCALGLTTQPLPAAAVTVTLNPLLRECVNDHLQRSPSLAVTDAQLRSLTTLECYGDIPSLSGLQYATNLVTFRLPLGALAGSLTIPNQWTKLQTLDLWGNDLTAITIPSTLTNLRTLDLSNNYLRTVSLPTTMVKLEDIDVSNNAIGSLHQLSWLPKTTFVYAANQLVPLPNWRTGSVYPLVSRTRNGNHTVMTLPAGVTRPLQGLVYSAPGTYSLRFNGDDTVTRLTTFNGRFTQTVTPGTWPVSYKGDHTGDRIADLYAVDSAGALKLYRGSTTSNFTLVGNRGSGWSGISYLTQVKDMTADGWSDLIVRRRSDHSLHLYAAGSGGSIISTLKIGQNWGQMDQIVPVGNLDGGSTQYVVAREATTGLLYRYTLTTSGLSGKKQIGRGWNAVRQIIGLGDFTGDGRADVLGIRHDGGLVVFPGNSSATIDGGRTVGRGWNTFRTAFSPGDVSGDGRPDLLGQSSAGELFVYDNLVGKWGYKRRVMTGTLGFRLLA